MNVDLIKMEQIDSEEKMDAYLNLELEKTKIFKDKIKLSQIISKEMQTEEMKEKIDRKGQANKQELIKIYQNIYYSFLESEFWKKKVERFNLSCGFANSQGDRMTSKVFKKINEVFMFLVNENVIQYRLKSFKTKTPLN